MSEGWISLHRGWRNNPIFRGEFSRADAWVWLIESASWKPTRTRIKGETVELARGELTFSQRFLAEKWGWSKSRVDRFIAELRQESMIETRSKIGATAGHNAGQGQCIITICNYAKYQDVAQPKRGNDSVEIGATAGQQRGKEEQGNKGTRERLEAKASCPSSDEPALRPEHIFERWNETAATLSKPRVRDLTPERRQLLKARIAQYALDDFLTVFGKIEGSAFLRGDTGWRGCAFDWVFKKANFQKILEGNYDE